MDVLQVNGLHAGYQGGFSLHDVTFSLPQGSFTGIIGPNGSGKTTLFRSLTGEILLSQGRVSLLGADVQLLPAVERARKMSVVTQFIDAPYMRVSDYVLTGRAPYRKPFQFFENAEDVEVASEYMELTGIVTKKDMWMHELSGGEQQLADMARALTQQPVLLLLDEPTSHLDISHQVNILNLLYRLKQEMALTILMIIHDLNLAGEYCDELILMDNGRVRIKGSPHEVLTYRHIEEVYGTVVVSTLNPVSHKPVIFPVADHVLKKKEI